MSCLTEWRRKVSTEKARTMRENNSPTSGATWSKRVPKEPLLILRQGRLRDEVELLLIDTKLEFPRGFNPFRDKCERQFPCAVPVPEADRAAGHFCQVETIVSPEGLESLKLERDLAISELERCLQRWAKL